MFTNMKSRIHSPSFRYAIIDRFSAFYSSTLNIFSKDLANKTIMQFFFIFTIRDHDYIASLFLCFT